MFGGKNIARAKLRTMCKNFDEIDEVIEQQRSSLCLIDGRAEDITIVAGKQGEFISALAMWRSIYEDDVATCRRILSTHNISKQTLVENVEHARYILRELKKSLQENRITRLSLHPQQ